MKKLTAVLPLFIAFIFTLSASAQGRYLIKGGDPNGINKWYMGRQIAHVMSHFGIDWLERQEREMEENTSQLIKNLNIKPGMTLADIGAGSGYHSALLSKKVGNGKVFAVDIEPEMINYLNNRIKLEKLNGIVPVLSKETNVSLPENTIDLVLIADGYHEFSYPYEMAVSILKALTTGVTPVLVEFRAEDDTVPIKDIHKMTEEQAVKELKVAGFTFEKNIKNLPWQHCMIFIKPAS
ncbi:MAG: class I SAM-dependent methyltransferase [Bacteroidota bacterium]